MVKRYETRYWNVRGLHRAGSITATARELASYKLDVVGVKEVKWDKGSAVPVEIIIFFVEVKAINWNRISCTTQNSISC